MDEKAMVKAHEVIHLNFFLSTLTFLGICDQVWTWTVLWYFPDAFCSVAIVGVRDFRQLEHCLGECKKEVGFLGFCFKLRKSFENLGLSYGRVLHVQTLKIVG